MFLEWLESSDSLHWRHNDHGGVSNHQPHGCLLNRLFRRRSKKTSKLRVTGFCVGNSPVPVISSHKGPVTRKMVPFDDVIMRVALPGLMGHWKSSLKAWNSKCRCNNVNLNHMTMTPWHALCKYWGPKLKLLWICSSTSWLSFRAQQCAFFLSFRSWYHLRYVGYDIPCA